MLAFSRCGSPLPQDLPGATAVRAAGDARVGRMGLTATVPGCTRAALRNISVRLFRIAARNRPDSCRFSEGRDHPFLEVLSRRPSRDTYNPRPVTCVQPLAVFRMDHQPVGVLVDPLELLEGFASVRTLEQAADFHAHVNRVGFVRVEVDVLGMGDVGRYPGNDQLGTLGTDRSAGSSVQCSPRSSLQNRCAGSVPAVQPGAWPLFRDDAML